MVNQGRTQAVCFQYLQQGGNYHLSYIKKVLVVNLINPYFHPLVRNGGEYTPWTCRKFS